MTPGSGVEWNEKTRALQELGPGDIMQVENQAGPHTKKWDVSGTVVEMMDYDQFVVRMDGSGHVTRRNRRFLRPIWTYASVSSGKGSSRAKVMTL